MLGVFVVSWGMEEFNAADASYSSELGFSRFGNL